jgi:hypothetical protein
MKPNPKRKRTQQERCKRCRESCISGTLARCHRMHMCLEFDAGDVRRVADHQRIVCDGKEWQYAEVVEKKGGEHCGLPTPSRGRW